MKTLLLIFLLLLFSGCGAEEEHMLVNTPETIISLKTLRAKKKFVEDTSLFYPGAPNETIRSEAEKVLNDALTKLINQSEKQISKDRFWGILKTAAIQYSEMDSEEKDRALSYMEEIMDIYGIESSDGRLNKLRYGFDLNQSH